MLKPPSMPPAARTELDKGTPCRNCGQALPEGKSACPACGAAQGQGNRCPHCHAVADAEPHRALGFSCLVCGGPRIALTAADVALGASTRAALVSAGSEQTKHVVFTAAGFVLTGMGALALLIASAVVLAAVPGPIATLATYLAASAPIVAGLWALARAHAARRLRGDALLTAQSSALSDVQAVTGALSAARVAELLRVSSERAELLLAEASVATLLDEAPAPRLRVDAPLAAEAGESMTEQQEPARRNTRGTTET